MFELGMYFSVFYYLCFVHDILMNMLEDKLMEVVYHNPDFEYGFIILDES